MSVIVFNKLFGEPIEWRIMVASDEFLRIWAPKENNSCPFPRYIYDVSDFSKGGE